MKHGGLQEQAKSGQLFFRVSLGTVPHLQTAPTSGCRREEGEAGASLDPLAARERDTAAAGVGTVTWGEPWSPASRGCSLAGGGLPWPPAQAVLTGGIIAMSLVSLDVLRSVGVRGVEQINVFIVVAGQQLWRRTGGTGVSRERVAEVASLLGLGVLQAPRVPGGASSTLPARCLPRPLPGPPTTRPSAPLRAGHSPEPSWL